ncbi:MAG: ribonuclease P protein component, partial [Gordonia polyisoprenivorans]|nr:ribonuclease P protein component [Gordonia polyisoprenivorans]
MLARPHRVTAGEDFRRVVRRGRRVSTRSSLVYIAEGSSGDPARFGFVIARSVGNAVHRNR